MMRRLRISKQKKPILIMVAVVVALLVIFAAWISINTQPVDASKTETVRIEVRSGASIEEVAALLGSKRLIRDSLAFSLYARLTLTKIEAGAYFISPSMSAADIAASLRSASNDTYNIIILPELTIPEVKNSLLEYGFTADEVDAALAAHYDHPLLADKPSDFDLEGYIFPDTYEMHVDDSVEDLLIKAFDNLYNKLQVDGSLAYITTRGLNIYETLTLASIVALEAADTGDQKTIAGVFWNRLDNGIALGSDVTYKYAYAMGYCDVDAPNCASAYNTRIHRGLPPGPIANMRYDTIQAVLHPTDSDYFYFLAGDDGQIYYGRTEDEHQTNIVNYCTVLCR